MTEKQKNTGFCGKPVFFCLEKSEEEFCIKIKEGDVSIGAAVLLCSDTNIPAKYEKYMCEM